MNYWLLAALSLTGVILNIYKRRACFVLWTLTNAAWAWRNYEIGEFPQAALMTIYAALAIWGYFRWKKEVEGRK